MEAGAQGCAASASSGTVKTGTAIASGYSSRTWAACGSVSGTPCRCTLAMSWSSSLVWWGASAVRLNALAGS
eukprot:6707021-Pyramimonas_sp.AAC.1